jgi:putative ubiquitin-RnfH superfamily antitoxin RatB of RatAB toxin-antitoxin module
MIRVAIAVALPGHQEVFELRLEEGATLADAIARARADERLAAFDIGAMKAGIWSREAGLATVLRDGDRVELYRELKADPKEARRLRARLKPSTRSRSGP